MWNTWTYTLTHGRWEQNMVQPPGKALWQFPIKLNVHASYNLAVLLQDKWTYNPSQWSLSLSILFELLLECKGNISSQLSIETLPCEMAWQEFIWSVKIILCSYETPIRIIILNEKSCFNLHTQTYLWSIILPLYLINKTTVMKGLTSVLQSIKLTFLKSTSILGLLTSKPTLLTRAFW